MEILITHLTRMQGDHVCVAGLAEDGSHVRPLARAGHLHRGHAHTDFALGNVVRLANPAPAPDNGFPEDWWIDADDSTAVRRAPDEEIRRRLQEVAVGSLRDAFPAIEVRGHNRWVVPQGRVTRSLAVVSAPAWRIVPKPQWDRAELSYRDGSVPAVALPLADLRLFPDGQELDFEVLQDLMGFVAMRTAALVSVGLGRPWAPDGETPVHWTQANTIWSGRPDRLVYGRTPPAPATAEAVGLAGD